MRSSYIVFLLLCMACGDSDVVVRGERPPGERPAAPPVAARTGVVHDVQMVGSIEGGFRFEPANLSIRVGDTVRWINGTGFPHNVAFYADRIPRGSETVLDAMMPAEGKLGPMNGRIVSELGDTFQMDFVNAPSGTYNYFCVVQEEMGMVATLTIEP